MPALRLAAVTAIIAATGSLVAVGPAVASAQVRSCSNDDLAATYHATDAGAGHRYGKLVLTNVSTSRCRTGGYGGLSYVGGGDGTQIGAAATRDRGKVRSLVLRPGQRVVSVVDALVAANYPRKTCHPARVDGFRVYVPNSTVSQFVAHRTRGCTSTKVHLLSHGPFRRP